MGWRKVCRGLRLNAIVRWRAAAFILVTIAWGAGQPPAFAAMESIDPGAAGVVAQPSSDRTPAVIVAPEGAEGPEAPMTRSRIPAGNPLWAIPLSVLTATHDRPLFSPSRRPPPAAVVVAPVIAPVTRPAAPDHPLLTLVGTVVGGRQGIGIFVDQASKAVIRLRTGQDHDGWTLRAVSERDVVFQRRRREATLVLPSRNVKGEPVTAAVTPAPGRARPSNTWMDGDGQLISPPKLAHIVRPVPSALSATWRDGDGQLITPPVRN